MLSDEYIAGFMDGEGTFGVYDTKTKYVLKSGEMKTGLSTAAYVQVTNTFRPVLVQIQEKYGGRLYENSNFKTGRRHCYHLSWKRAEMMVFLPRIIPHLVEKKDRAQAVLDYLESRNKV